MGNNQIEQSFMLIHTRGLASCFKPKEDYIDDLLLAMWKLEKILPQIFERLSQAESRIAELEQLLSIKQSTEQQTSETLVEIEEMKSLKQLIDRISVLERKVAALSTDNTQLNQNNHQQSEHLPIDFIEQIAIAALAQVPTHYPIMVNSDPEVSIKIQFFYKVALAKRVMNVRNELEALEWAKSEYSSRVSFFRRKNVDNWYEEIKELSPDEILALARQMMNGITIQDDIHNFGK